MTEYELQFDIRSIWGSVLRGTLYYRSDGGFWYTDEALSHPVDDWLADVLKAFYANPAGLLIETPKRWRAGDNGSYFYVDFSVSVDRSFDCRDMIDATRNKTGNYFRTKTQAKAAAQAVKALLTYIHSDSEAHDVEFASLVAAFHEARQAVKQDL